MLTILYRAAKGSLRRPNLLLVEAKVTNKTLCKQSGFSKDVVSRALKELREARFIRICLERRKLGEFGASLYLICNPADGEPLVPNGRSSFLLAHRIPYFTFPICFIAELEARWSLANMSKSEKQLYFSLCWLANIKRNNQFSTTRENLTKLAAFSTKTTTEKALRGLTNKALLSVEGMVGSATIGIHLFAPYTGEPLHDQTLEPESDPANYYSTTTSRRIILNSGNPEAVERQVRSYLPEGSLVVSQANGGFKICCPFHQDDTPSCSVNPTQRCFYCFGCREKGTLTQLLMKLSSEDQRNAIRGMAEAEGCALEYHMPDKNAEAIYSYCDKEGWLVKQVLRFPGKQFTQKRFTSNGWSYSVADADPLLYHADRLIFTDTVAICEGEKDCDTVMGLSLWGTSGNELIATTSGSSNSWRDEFADDLLGKRVILMPDDDEAGARYADAIVASLESRGIEHRIVCFSDVGAKDVSEFLEQGHSKEELVERMGSDWVAASAPTIIEEPTVLEDA